MSNIIKIALVGAAGRMGKEIIQATAQNDNAVIGAAIEYKESPLLGKDAGELAGVGNIGVPIEADLEKAAKECDVILDISLPTATNGVIETALKISKPLVCGITGVSDESLENFKKAGAKIPVIHTKNFSVGIAVLSSLAAKAAATLGENYDIEIIEKHHRRKIDAPSGTAQILADAISANSDDDKNYTYGRNGNTGIRDSSEIGIHAIRGGGIFGEHTVILAGENERIELTHKAETRSLFAQGAVTTSIFIAQAKPASYTMSDVLGLN